MTALRPIAVLDTHEVTNQPPPLEDLDLFHADRALGEAVARAGGAGHAGRLSALGVRVGSAEVQDWGAQANRHAPELETFDRFGRRVDEVRFHPIPLYVMARC